MRKEATYDEIMPATYHHTTLLTQLAAGLLMPIRELNRSNMIATEQEGVEENGETN